MKRYHFDREEVLRYDPPGSCQHGTSHRAVAIVDQIGGVTNGAAIRQHHIVRAIAMNATTLVVIVNANQRDDDGTLGEELGSDVVVVAPRTRTHQRALATMVAHPHRSWRRARVDEGRLADELARVVQAFAPHFVYCSSEIGWHALPTSLRARTAFDVIDRPLSFHRANLQAMARRAARRAPVHRQRNDLGTARPRLRSAIKHVDGLIRARSFERELARSARLVLSCNPDDPGRGDNHVIVPNSAVAPGPTPDAAALSRVVIPAGFRYEPNLDGAEWFLTKVMAQIRARLDPVPEVLLVGSEPPGLAQLAARHGAHTTGWLPTIDEVLTPGTVVAVPVLEGSGTRLKIIEAWGRGLPVVSTTKGAEGLGGRDGVDLLIADDAAEFAAAIGRLRDADLAREIGRAGARRFEAGFSARLLADQMRSIMTIVSAGAGLPAK